MQAWRENCDFWSVLLGCGTYWQKVPGGLKCCRVVRCALSSPAPRICSETSGLSPSALSSLDKRPILPPDSGQQILVEVSNPLSGMPHGKEF